MFAKLCRHFAYLQKVCGHARMEVLGERLPELGNAAWWNRVQGL